MLAVLLGAAHFAFCQGGKKLTLDQLISVLQKKQGVAFSYDVELVKGIPVSVDTNATLHDILNTLTLRTAFSFEHVDKKNILIKPRAANGNFVVCGTVYDKKTKEALLGALVYERKGKFVTSANESGSFYKIIRYGENDSVTVSSVGYHSVTLPISVFAGGTCPDIFVESIFTELKDVVVTAYITQGVSYDAMDNSINIRPKNLSILPGQTNGDVLLALDALPGISAPDGKAGNLNVRGSTPDQTMIIFDNIPIYHKGHYFGTLSPFNPSSVDNIKVQRNTMSADNGGRAGGFVEISTASAVSNTLQGNLSASLLDANVYIHAPIVKNKVSLLVSARRSFPFNNVVPTLNTLSTFVFQRTEIAPYLEDLPGFQLKKLTFNYSDANAKLICNLSSKHKLITSGLLLYNDMIVAGIANNGPLRTDTVKLFNWGFSTSLHSVWSSRFSTKFSVTNSFFVQEFRTDKAYSPSYHGNTLCKNQAGDFRIFFETDNKISERYSLKSGYDMRYHDMNYDKAARDTFSPSKAIRMGGKGAIHTVFVNLLAKPTDKFLVNAGIRANYFSVNSKIYPEPRVSLGYKFNQQFRLKTSGGYQTQFVTQISGVSVESIGGIENLLWTLADDKGIATVNCAQATFGGLYERKGWLIDLEGYYKEIKDVTYININSVSENGPTYFINGNINTVGADLLVRKQYKHLDAWASYTLSQSMMQFDSINSGAAFYSLYDQTHVLDLACAYKLGQFKFSLAWKYRTGLAALPGIRTKLLAGASSQPTNGQGQNPPPPPPPPPPGQPAPKPPTIEGEYTGRFPDYHQLDASVTYTFPKVHRNWKGVIGLTGLNCYNRKNIIGQVIEKQSGKMVIHNRYSLGFMPNLFVTLYWL